MWLKFCGFGYIWVYSIIISKFPIKIFIPVQGGSKVGVKNNSNTALCDEELKYSIVMKSKTGYRAIGPSIIGHDCMVQWRFYAFLL